MSASATDRAATKELIADLKAIESAANALMQANRRLAERGGIYVDGKFTAIYGGAEYLANWRRWVRDNLNADW